MKNKHNYLLNHKLEESMKNTTLLFKFHDPNNADVTANQFLAILIQANMKSIESEILHTMNSEKTNKRTRTTPNGAAVSTATL